MVLKTENKYHNILPSLIGQLCGTKTWLTIEMSTMSWDLVHIQHAEPSEYCPWPSVNFVSSRILNEVNYFSENWRDLDQNVSRWKN